MITEVSDMSIAHQVLTCKTCKKTFSIAKPYDFVEYVNECMKNEEAAIEEIEESEMPPKHDLHHEIKAVEKEMLASFTG